MTKPKPPELHKKRGRPGQPREAITMRPRVEVVTAFKGLAEELGGHEPALVHLLKLAGRLPKTYN